MKQLHYFSLAVTFLPAVMSAQDFVNGSFEQNGNLCLINASTTVFNANMKNVHAFGSFRKPDIASSDCGFGDAKDGNWFVGLATNVQGEVRSEAITLELNAPLVKGNNYSLNFWTRKRAFAPDIEIGQSTSDSTSGEIFYTASANSIGTDWTQITLRFTAPNNGKYISVRAVNPNTNSGVWLDAFKMNAVFVPDNVVMTSHNEPSKNTVAVNKNTATVVSHSPELYPNPSEGIFRVNSDTTELASLIVYNMLGTTVETHLATSDQPIPDKIDLTAQEPGMYFVEMATVDGDKITRRIIVSR
ncbi:MAG: T9SS type A sorting domain-containing protein [Bacteroidetes bacterium]|nr:T9SS type A sorting domain-containing protein [Bacteroidota bacterium]